MEKHFFEPQTFDQTNTGFYQSVFPVQYVCTLSDCLVLNMFCKLLISVWDTSCCRRLLTVSSWAYHHGLKTRCLHQDWVTDESSEHVIPFVITSSHLSWPPELYRNARRNPTHEWMKVFIHHLLQSKTCFTAVKLKPLHLILTLMSSWVCFNGVFIR